MDDLKTPTFWLWLVTTVLIAIVAVGQRQLYSRVETVETSLGLQATQQSQQTPSRQQQPKGQE
jgi:hypothetical protein